MKSEVRVKRGARGVLSVMLLALGIVPVAAQRAGELPKRASILDIQIGTAASEIPDEFINYACGTNGDHRPEVGGLAPVALHAVVKDL